jgi:PAS domain S-box-containing protein
MRYQITIHIGLLVISGLISLSLGIYTFLRRRNTKGANFFILNMFVVTLWSIPNALEMVAIDLPAKLFWANVQYFAYCYSPVTLLALCMEFTGFDKWVKGKKILWLAILPTIILLLVWTDGLHGLIRYEIQLDTSGEFPVIVKKYGYGFYVHAIYSHTLNLIAVILLIRAIFFNNLLYRRQAIPLLTGIGLIMIPNLLYITGISSLRYDITPIFFGFGGLIMLWGIFRYRMFDLVPVARATVIETMDAGIMVLDIQNRILDMNPAFRKLLRIDGSMIFSRSIKELCSLVPELVEVLMDRSITHTEFMVETKENIKIYEIIISPLYDKKDTYIGRLAVTYDITEQKQARQELFKQQWKMAVIEERERMARDMHDNLGQVLGFINFQAQAIQQTLQKEGIDIVTPKLDQLLGATQTAHAEIREYISSVRTSVSVEKDFITSLKNCIKDFENQAGIQVEQNITFELNEGELKPIIWINILNIIREAMNNIRKHANAKRVRLTLTSKDNQLYTVIEDDGNGFDLIQNNMIKTKFGLDIMRERATEIGGKIVIESVVGKGCRITLNLSIERGDKQNAAKIVVGR